MESRKLIKQGGGGYTIYLPKKWIEKKGLKEGMEIRLVETAANLIIGSDVKEKAEITLTVNKDNIKNIKNILTHSYRKGFNKMNLTLEKKEYVKEISKICSELLLGFEVTDVKEDSCTLENISEPTEGRYDVILRKVFLILNELQKETIENFESKFYNFKEIQEMKNNLDKFILFLRRLLIKEKYDKDLTLEWEFLTFLMHIGHTNYYLYKYASENKIKANKDMIKILNEFRVYFSYFEKAYYNKDIESINKINTLKEKYQFGEIIRLIEHSHGKEAVFYSYVRELFRIVQIGTSPVLVEILDIKE